MEKGGAGTAGSAVVKRVIIMGAAGRDFHVFNTVFRGDPGYDVVAFTASQIPGIAGRRYPTELAGRNYSKGIPIYPESDLARLVGELSVDVCVLAYSDLSHLEVMHKASLVNALGPEFRLLGTKTTMLKSSKPVVAVCAVRTGAGKSQTSRFVVQALRRLGKRAVVVRHPMPYGELMKQVVQRFGTERDLEKNRVTLEEREEYEQHLERGTVVFGGVDYEKVLRSAEKECDVIVWDGGNNDTPFFRPDLHFVVADPLRPGNELSYYPGETNVRMADVVVVNKCNAAKPEDVRTVVRNVKSVNKKAAIVLADSVISVDAPEMIRGKRVLVIEDGPTLTHGGMSFGAGYVAAKLYKAKEIIDARKHAAGSIRKTFEQYAHLSRVLPAMGYSESQLRELEQTVRDSRCDAVVVGTPIDLRRIVRFDKPVVRVRYELKERKGYEGTIEKAIKSVILSGKKRRD